VKNLHALKRNFILVDQMGRMQNRIIQGISLQVTENCQYKSHQFIHLYSTRNNLSILTNAKRGSSNAIFSKPKGHQEEEILVIGRIQRIISLTMAISIS